MRIQKVQIEGFGPLYKREVGPLSPRVNVITGPNEAGKSALRAFIRTVLLGFPRAGSIEDRAFGYPAVDGVAHGGSIEFLDSEGRTFLIERIRRPRGPYSGVVRILRDQAVSNEEDLAALLSHLGGRVHDNVFSLSLQELQGLDQDVQQRIWSAGIGSTGAVISNVREGLVREQTELGKKLNEIRRAISEEMKTYASARAELAQYGQVSEEVARLESLIAVLRHSVGE
ncbi:MAG: AAA family ATPase, partial [Chloroflexi bacterium]|nr:AAA family ATPase [Chloroflexota bacterium]